MVRSAAALAFVLVLATAASGAAQRAACTESLSETEVRARLEVLRGVARREEPAVRRWFTTFALLHSTMAAGGAILAATQSTDQSRALLIIGAASSALALGSLVVVGPPMMGARNHIASLPEGTPEERLYKLRMAEHLLRRGADSVDFVRSWLPATLSMAYVAGMASVLLFAFDQGVGSITFTIGGVVLGLGRILLRPTGPRDAWRRYVAAHPDADCDEIRAAALPPGPRVALMPHGLGLGLRIDF